ncbi:MAG: methyltransferase domain-containing protein [Vicinamibacterales bacterium]
MISIRRRTLLLVLPWIMSAGLLAQTQRQAAPPEPKVGQPGKDVVWVPTPDAVVAKMLDMAAVTPQDYVIDLGSGDGRTVIGAARRGATAHGIEYNPDLVVLSRRAAAAAGVGDRATFAQADLFNSDFSRATVLTMFLLPEINMRLRPIILGLKPGTRIVSNTFSMQDWEADEIATVANCPVYCTVHLWLVPAKVEGVWRLPAGDLELQQQFQVVRGTLTSGTSTTPTAGGRLRGDRISFTVAGDQYVGRVNGDAMDGTMRSQGATSTWRATRVRR